MKVLAVIGTRPEAIKMAPIVIKLKEASGTRVTVVATAQHRELLDQVFQEFEISPDHDLNLMSPGQSLSGFASRCLIALDPIVRSEAPGVVIAQGDTTTTFISALVSFYNRIPFAHVEAGLRTGDFYNPYPEEFNRVATSQITDYHFAPTVVAHNNLLREGVSADRIMVTGNTIIDALYFIRDRHLRDKTVQKGGPPKALVTVHRRENFGEPLEHICRAIQRILAKSPALEIVWPVHPNPEVHGRIHAFFDKEQRVRLTAPLQYGEFVRAMSEADFILTDSGGVQEEAPALGKPVLILREVTERPEAVTMGGATLVGTQEDSIVNAAMKLLNDPATYSEMARVRLPYGDGRSAEKIVTTLFKRYGR